MENAREQRTDSEYKCLSYYPVVVLRLAALRLAADVGCAKSVLSLVPSHRDRLRRTHANERKRIEGLNGSAEQRWREGKAAVQSPGREIEGE